MNFLNAILLTPMTRLASQYERLNMEITYLEKIYHSVYKRFPSAIDHLDYHPSMNNNEPSVGCDTKTSLTKTPCRKCNLTGPSYVPKGQYSELSLSEERI